MAWRTIQQYKLAVSGTASTALAISEIAAAYQNNQVPQARIFADGCGVVANFGGGSVAADATENGSTKKLAAGNVHFPDGAIDTICPQRSDTHISVISDDETSTGVAWLNIGYEV